MTEKTQPTDAEILDAADAFRIQYKHGGTTFDGFDALGHARAVLAKWGTQPAPADSMLEDAARLDWLESQSQVNIERVRYLGADTSIYEVTPFNGTDYNGETLRKATIERAAARHLAEMKGSAPCKGIELSDKSTTYKACQLGGANCIEGRLAFYPAANSPKQDQNEAV